MRGNGASTEANYKRFMSNSSMVRVSDDEDPRFVSNEATNKIKSLENRIQELEKQIVLLLEGLKRLPD